MDWTRWLVVAAAFVACIASAVMGDGTMVVVCLVTTYGAVVWRADGLPELVRRIRER